jgi:hypothetical protein
MVQFFPGSAKGLFRFAISKSAILKYAIRTSDF